MCFLSLQGVLHVLCSSSSWFDHSNFWRRVQIMKLLIAQFFFSLFLFHPFLCPNILTSTLFANILSLCSSLNVRDQASHPHKTVIIYRIWGSHSGMIMFLKSINWLASLIEMYSVFSEVRNESLNITCIIFFPQRLTSLITFCTSGLANLRNENEFYWHGAEASKLFTRTAVERGLSNSVPCFQNWQNCPATAKFGTNKFELFYWLL
jgi:hypothetical protein